MVLDSIIGSHGIGIHNGDTTYMPEGRELTLEKHYLVTGYADMKRVEHKIDSLLPLLVDSTVINRKTTRIHFFKKTNRCNSAYGRWNEEYTEFESANECLMFRYEMSTNYPTYKRVSIHKTSCENSLGRKYYTTNWNREYIFKDSTSWTNFSYDKLKPGDRNSGMKLLFDRVVDLAKQKLKERGEEVGEGYKRYHVR